MLRSKRKQIHSGHSKPFAPPFLRIEEINRSEAELTRFIVTNFGSSPAENAFCNIFVAPDGIDIGERLVEQALTTSFVGQYQIGTVPLDRSIDLSVILEAGVLFLLIIHCNDSAGNTYGTHALFIKHGERFRIPCAYHQYEDFS